MNQLEQSQFEDLKNQVKFLSNLVENLTNARPVSPPHCSNSKFYNMEDAISTESSRL